MTLRIRKKKGFTIVEVMISIAVISVALLGTLSALAFGVRATDLTTHNTEAEAIQRRILELILCGGPKGPVVGGGALNNGAGSVYDNQWRSLTTFANTAPMSPNDFISSLDTQDVRRFAETSGKYQVLVKLEQCDGSATVDPANYKSTLVNVTVGVRWYEKVGNVDATSKQRTLSMMAFYRK